MTTQLPLFGTKCSVGNCRSLVTATVETSSGYVLRVCDACARSLVSMGWHLEATAYKPRLLPAAEAHEQGGLL